MPEIIAEIEVPDTDLVREATSVVREATDDTVFDHSRRVFFWGSLKARARGLELDPELAYVGAMFHDLGLTSKYRTTNRRFELDGAEAADRSCGLTDAVRPTPRRCGSPSRSTRPLRCPWGWPRRSRW